MTIKWVVRPGPCYLMVAAARWYARGGRTVSKGLVKGTKPLMREILYDI